MPDNNQLDSQVGTPLTGDVPTLPEPTQEGYGAEASTELSASRTPAIIAGVVAVVTLVVLILIGVWLFNHPAAAAVLRDIFIILLGIQSIIIGLLLLVLVVATIYVALKMYDLTQFVQDELRPMLQRADDTLRTVQSRTAFVSDAAVKPVIEVMSYAAWMRAILRSFTRPRG